jgi:hypothetical protein
MDPQHWIKVNPCSDPDWKGQTNAHPDINFFVSLARQKFKGTVSRDGFGFGGQAWSVLGLNRGHSHFLTAININKLFAL